MKKTLSIAVFLYATIAATHVDSDPSFAKKAADPHILFLVNNDPNNYQAHRSIPAYAEKLEREFGYRTTVIEAAGEIPALRFPELKDRLSRADVLVIFFRRAALPSEQMAAIKQYLKNGKPLVGIRTANHAFSVRPRDGEIPDGYEDWKHFVPGILGTKNRGYGPVEPGTLVQADPKKQNHPVLKDVDPGQWHSTGNLYYNSLVSSDAAVLLTGNVNKDTQPIAWTRFAGKSRVFYTSLGHPSDFDTKPFITLLTNGIRWALE